MHIDGIILLCIWTAVGQFYKAYTHIFYNILMCVRAEESLPYRKSFFSLYSACSVSYSRLFYYYIYRI